MADPKDTNIFQDIAQQKPASIPASAYIKAREWFRTEAAKLTDFQPDTLFKQMGKNLVRTLNIASVGSLYLYAYDPKYKATLKYYDTYPLAFIVEMTNNGWTGLNLHYLPPYHRAQLMNALYDITLKSGDRQKVQMSYQILNSARKFQAFGPCYHRYLAANASSLLFIEPKHWDTALMLPTARFVGATESQVWKDSKGKF